jgi:hypothetical protein
MSKNEMAYIEYEAKKKRATQDRLWPLAFLNVAIAYLLCQTIVAAGHGSMRLYALLLHAPWAGLGLVIKIFGTLSLIFLLVGSAGVIFFSASWPRKATMYGHAATVATLVAVMMMSEMQLELLWDSVPLLLIVVAAFAFSGVDFRVEGQES